jgi:hypothetical protein
MKLKNHRKDSIEKHVAINGIEKQHCKWQLKMAVKNSLEKKA